MEKLLEYLEITLKELSYFHCKWESDGNKSKIQKTSMNHLNWH